MYVLGPPCDCRPGTVNLGAESTPADVLLVNGNAGDGFERAVTVAVGDPIEVSMMAPPSLASAPFALYLWRNRIPVGETVAPQPHGIGTMCLGTFITGLPEFEPDKIWNNAGREHLLGTPDFPSTPAPSVVGSVNGIPFPLTVTLQGFIKDLASAGTKPASVTNAIILRIE